MAGAGLRGLHLESGMKVGLFGGSFDPAHEGHAHVAGAALRRLGLDRIIWLVSPRNPIKTDAPHASAPDRLAGARRLAQGPWMIVSDAESRLGSAFTIDTIRAFKARFGGVRFVWIMGADALAGMHRWRSWRQIMREVPVAVISRPGAAPAGLFSPAARAFAHDRLAPTAAPLLALRRPPAWIYLCEPLNFASSTALRNRR